ncbi:MAG: methyl-accepting chemotaxis protein [Ignavibacteriales bacterium]|nr:methyl-accepting chemotaxis protein [Ignavibacteriales bacterium]
MNWFKNLKIKAKLLVSFLLVSFITGVVGYIGVLKLKQADDSDTFLYEKNTVPIAIISDLRTDFQKQRVNTLEAIINAKDPVKQAEAIKQIQERDAAIKLNIPEYEKTYIDENDKKQFEEFKAAWNEYLPKREALIALSNQNQDQALANLRGDFDASITKVQDLLYKINDLNGKSAKERSDSNTVEADSASRTMIIFMVVGVLLAVIIGWLLAGYFSKAVNKVKDRMKQLESVCITNLGNGLMGMSKGNLSLKVEKATNNLEVKTKDEIGEMTEVFNSMLSKAQAGIDAYEGVRAKINMLTAELQQLIEDSKNGLLDNRGDVTKFEGAYNGIVNGMNEMLDAVILPVQDGAKVLEVMATGDFTQRVTAEYKGQHKMIKQSINNLGDSVGSILREVSEAVQATASASNQISSSTEEMSAGAQEQSAQTTEVAGAVEEMTKTIFETTKNSGQASDAAKNAGNIAKEGGKVVGETIDGMNKIAEVVQRSADTVQVLGKRSDEIGEIVQVIDDIADQTNLLALNAAIEAARAGEQGRGFAVVADEVRKLAERTTKATKEIATMIRQIQKDTEGAVVSMQQGTEEVEKGKALAEKAGQSLKEIITGAQDVVDMSTQVAAASEEQSSAAEQISKNIESISSVTQQSAAGVQQIAKAAEDLNRLTDNLQNLVSQFKINESDNVLKSNFEVKNISHKDNGSHTQLAVRKNGKLIHS